VPTRGAKRQRHHVRAVGRDASGLSEDGRGHALKFDDRLLVLAEVKVVMSCGAAGVDHRVAARAAKRPGLSEHRVERGIAEDVRGAEPRHDGERQEVEAVRSAQLHRFVGDPRARGGVALDEQRDRQVQLRPRLFDERARGARHLDGLVHPLRRLAFEQLELRQRNDAPDPIGSQARVGGHLLVVWMQASGPNSSSLKTRVVGGNALPVGPESTALTWTSISSDPAALLLGALLDRDFEVRQGRGSVIAVHPRQDGLVEIGGRVRLDEVRAFHV